MDNPNPHKTIDYSDLKITYFEYLSVIGYLTKTMEDVIIRKARFLSVLLLAVDIPLAIALLIVNIERLVYQEIIEFLLSHVMFDIRPLVRRFRNFIPEKQVEKLLGGEEEQIMEEETVSGKLFQTTYDFLRFIWAVLVFALFLPIWPLIFMYRIFINFVIVGVFYYFLIFSTFTGFLGGALYFLMFVTVTFLVASISVPFFMKLFIYLKYIFSLERKSWKVINNEAKAAFFDFYLRTHASRIRVFDDLAKKQPQKIKSDGGIYYLFLKVIHGIKNRFLRLRLKSLRNTFTKLEQSLLSMEADITEEKQEYEKTLSEIQKSEIIHITIALGITFIFSGWLAMVGLEGHNILASVFLSFLSKDFANTAWSNYENSGFGYYEYLTHYYTFIPGFGRFIAAAVDYFWRYFFQAYYYLLPGYLSFTASYYGYFGDLAKKLF